MKIKQLVVASMSVLGLISVSCPAFAATHHAKNKVAKKHHIEVSRTDYKGDYKGALPIPVCPITDQYTLTLDAMDQNLGRAKPTENCDKLISLAGGINFDFHWFNRSMGYQGENIQRVSLNDAYLNIYGNVNDWAKAFASLSYNDATTNSAVVPPTTTVKNGQYSNVYSNSNLNLEQGFIRFANFNETPFFVQLGKQFQNFGRYKIHPITRTMAQVMTESLQDSAEIGFLTAMGLHGSIYAFDTPLRGRSNVSLGSTIGHTTTDYGAALGFDHLNDQLGFDLGIGYMYNIVGVNDVAQAVSQYQSGAVSNNGGTYDNTVGAGTVYGDIYSGPFYAGLRYVSALKHFSPNDLGNKGTSAVAFGTGKGAKPWAGDIKVGYAFAGWNRNQNVYVGYQASGDAVNIYLPQHRWLVGYGIDVWTNTYIGAEVGFDSDYGTGQGGTGNNSSTLGLRAAVKFG